MRWKSGDNAQERMCSGIWRLHKISCAFSRFGWNNFGCYSTFWSAVCVHNCQTDKEEPWILNRDEKEFHGSEIINLLLSRFVT